MADASTKWYPNGDPVLICITGTPLEGHSKTTGNALATNNPSSSGIPVYTGV